MLKKQNIKIYKKIQKQFEEFFGRSLLFVFVDYLPFIGNLLQRSLFFFESI